MQLQITAETPIDTVSDAAQVTQEYGHKRTMMTSVWCVPAFAQSVCLLRCLKTLLGTSTADASASGPAQNMRCRRRRLLIDALHRRHCGRSTHAATAPFRSCPTMHALWGATGTRPSCTST